MVLGFLAALAAPTATQLAAPTATPAATGGASALAVRLFRSGTVRARCVHCLYRGLGLGILRRGRLVLALAACVATPATGLTGLTGLSRFASARRFRPCLRRVLLHRSFVLLTIGAWRRRFARFVATVGASVAAGFALRVAC
ncbi:MAG: hypothetical protein AW10_00770 [Candidatus Accumulibacter appositus]|uniref:Secreted protein n=1 Tax=Candidatus Accumulibacter appositus TaxID=1454003 RepID=A0A011PYX8_9PROT|nr:MAG: hypothetical protein AW10_00770 [Candidatus Accumulibacter appositus]